MKSFRLLHRSTRAELSSARTSASSSQPISWKILLLCVAGFIIGFAYLLRSNPAGWFLLLGFAFLLIMQTLPRNGHRS